MLLTYIRRWRESIRSTVRVAVFTALVLGFCHPAEAQADLQKLVDTEQQFDRAVAVDARAAYLGFLSSDSIVFKTDAASGIEFWRTDDLSASRQLIRTLTLSDISANGMLGYTTGSWRSYERKKSDASARFGQYVTIWEKQPDGRFLAAVDIGITHEKLPFRETDRRGDIRITRDMNERGWSPADASMNFLRMSMTTSTLGGAFRKFAAPDVRLLRDGAPPITGKKRVVREMMNYRSVEFPSKVNMFQAADLAYFWNRCEFASSSEGMEKGNCLHIMKLRKKKWWIVLGVFSRAENPVVPILKQRQTARQD